jgi:hypothetical protein
LFKKIAAVNKSESDSEEPSLKNEAAEKDEPTPDEKIAVKTTLTAKAKQTSDFFEDPFSVSAIPAMPAVSPSKNVIKNTSGDDFFQEIEVDRAFTDSSFKSAQKVRQLTIVMFLIKINII